MKHDGSGVKVVVSAGIVEAVWAMVEEVIFEPLQVLAVKLRRDAVAV